MFLVWYVWCMCGVCVVYVWYVRGLGIEIISCILEC
jgi:hypothetical protein